MKRVKIDKIGRIVIPINMRRALGSDENLEVNVELLDGSIIISPCNRLCKICGDRLSSHSDLTVCDKCVEMIKKI